MSFLGRLAPNRRRSCRHAGACLVAYLILILFAFGFAVVLLPAFTNELSFALMRGFNPHLSTITAMQDGGGSQSNNNGDASTAGPCGGPGQAACPDMSGSGDRELES